MATKFSQINDKRFYSPNAITSLSIRLPSSSKLTKHKEEKKLTSNNSIVHFKFRMDIEKYSYDGKFTGNILALGETGCGKTTFVQNVGKNSMFRKN